LHYTCSLKIFKKGNKSVTINKRKGDVMANVTAQMVICKRCKNLYDKNAPGNITGKCPHCMKKDIEKLEKLKIVKR